MQEIKSNVYRCPCCGWGAEQLTISEGDDHLESLPQDVQQAWNIVAKYLDDRPEFSFSISAWYNCGEPDERASYSIETFEGEQIKTVVAAAVLREKNGPAPAAGHREDRIAQPAGEGRPFISSSNNKGGI
ncbi:hypothetical protein [Paenibacillus sp. IHBB 3054]|uniref:hypothetical protein n=1 Tax=Paenibacillus sp. IHBB 3054 TaxID=3425689 RepID=UPI003F67C51D